MLLSDETEKVGCQKCHERGYHIRDTIHIMRICRYCGGRGFVDWIDHMTGNPSPLPLDKSVEERIVMRNIEHLMHQIKIMLHEINIQATVSVEKHDILHGCNESIIPISNDIKIEHRFLKYPKKIILSF